MPLSPKVDILKSYRSLTRRAQASSRDWRTFAAATGAALAASSSASADIIHQTVNKTITLGQHSGLLNQTLVNVGPLGTGTLLDGNNYNAGLRVGSNFAHYFIGQAIHRFGGSEVVGKPIGSGYSITAGKNFGALGAFLTFEGLINYNQFHSTAVAPSNSAFFGFKASNGDLGWVRLTDTGTAGHVPTSVTLVDYAYNNVAGGSIYAGEGILTPEPGSMGLSLLALGAAGVVALRRRRKLVPDAN